MKRTFTFTAAMGLLTILLFKLHFILMFIPIILCFVYLKKSFRLLGSILMLLIIVSLMYQDFRYDSYQILETKDKEVALKAYGADYQLEFDGYRVLLKSDMDLLAGEYRVTYDKYQFFYQNPNTFSYKKYLRSLGFVDVLESDNCHLELIESHKTLKLPRRDFASSPYQGVYKALVYADKSDLDQKIYHKNGTSHILAISGLHIGLIYGLLYGLISFFNKTRGRWLSLIMVFLYVAMINYPISGLRAFIMLVLGYVAYLSDRKYDLLQSIGLLSLIMMILNPYVIYHTGFQYSFCAVLVIEVIYKPLFKHTPKYFALILLPMVIQLGMLPLTIYHQNTIHLLSFVCNVFSVFLITWVLYALLLYVLCPLEMLLYFADFIYGFIDKINIFFSGMSGFQLTLPSFHMIWVISFYMVLMLYREKKFRRPMVYMIVCLMICMIIYYSLVVEIYFFDIGQGDCMLVRKGFDTLLIDGGRKTENVLIRDVLLKQGISSVDLVMLSHSDMDHLGGLTQIPEMTYKSKLLYKRPNEEKEDFYDLLVSEKIPCRDQVFDFSFCQFECLDYPIGDTYNNASLIGYLTVYDTTVFLTGDIEAEVEERLNLKPVDILKVPHHGSTSSSTPDFIDALSPDNALICVGKNNYGHPSQTVLNRYESRNIPIYKTLDGCVKVWILPFNIYFIKTLN
ncbi:DNA internalization-related competence protein ComEC/Rec2 [Acidaminobacter sp. JC074]|uniref:DNA internalization-related competence protein ComEC/Rec2 n=1 Tax=Acidaminobacter sp. JC074 TaxID=2530199 RepID=UPI001F0CE3F9|nr:DNA internalization-related competence protein ComEC/Rec2 [Acidaminobacter sp. JC074]MCH4887743.1 DNA internalization-related competence protein ComEC/Rec2 [Acidaminobacter sp. JC074]